MLVRVAGNSNVSSEHMISPSLWFGSAPALGMLPLEPNWPKSLAKTYFHTAHTMGPQTGSWGPSGADYRCQVQAHAGIDSIAAT